MTREGIAIVVAFTTVIGGSSVAPRVWADDDGCSTLSTCKATVANHEKTIQQLVTAKNAAFDEVTSLKRDLKSCEMKLSLDFVMKWRRAEVEALRPKNGPALRAPAAGAPTDPGPSIGAEQLQEMEKMLREIELLTRERDKLKLKRPTPVLAAPAPS